MERECAEGVSLAVAYQSTPRYDSQADSPRRWNLPSFLKGEICQTICEDSLSLTNNGALGSHIDLRKGGPFAANHASWGGLYLCYGAERDKDSFQGDDLCGLPLR